MSQTAKSPGDCGPRAWKVSTSADSRDLPNTEPKNVKRIDCRGHLEFHAYDLNGRRVGTFPDQRSAARALPAVELAT